MGDEGDGGHTVEDDGVADDGVDALRLEGGGRVSGGLLAADGDDDGCLRCGERAREELQIVRIPATESKAKKCKKRYSWCYSEDSQRRRRI